jgi:hypothetical protein
MKVIAIKNADVIKLKNDFFKKEFNTSEDELKAYKIGDIFDVIETEFTSINSIDIILIYNTNFNREMIVTRSNFITLEEWREQQLNTIIK